MCGHIVRIDCGHGPLDTIVTNSNPGGGLDLYSASTWLKATHNQASGQAHCSVQLTNINPISGKWIFNVVAQPKEGVKNIYIVTGRI